jgi:hypothetical protein
MTVFIHIGAPKTGTTSIQHAMFRNADRLRREYSINYPSVALNHWAIIIPYIAEENYRPIRNHLLRGIGTRARFAAMAKAYATGFKRDGTRYRTHVLSSEQLLIADRDAIAGLRGFFAGLGLDVKIVVYIRHPGERLSSLVSQQLRGGETDLKSFVFRDMTAPAVRAYADVFGKENIIIRRFGERYFLNGDLIDDFTAVINQVPIKGLNPERLNDSLSLPAVMLAERLFKIAPLASGERGREEYLLRVAGPKFRAPRWMVEKAIEAHREGMVYLEAEFGIRFHDIDLSAFPEEITWEFSEEAIASVAAILHEQSTKIHELNAKLKGCRWHRRIRENLRGLIGTTRT